MTLEEIQDNYRRILDQIRQTALKCGRPENSVRLMAVSKFHTAEEIAAAIDAGATLFGENHVQEATEKFPPILREHPQIALHQIGVLQRNKVKKILPLVSCVQSVSSISLFNEIAKCADNQGREIDALLEFRTGEESKSGFESYDDVCAVLEAAKKAKNVAVKGFMTIAPFCEDKKRIRAAFSSLRGIKERAARDFPQLSLDELSMGMTADFQIAIEEGSTLVRVGTAIFGARNYG